MKILSHIKYLFILGIVFVSMNAHSQKTMLTVISNQEGAPAELKKSELKYIFLGEKERWGNGSRIKIALMKPGSISGKQMCKKIFDMSEDDFANYWEEQSFAGKLRKPAYFKNITELQTYVSENPGAIGFIDQTPITSNIKIVLIDGKKSF